MHIAFITNEYPPERHGGVATCTSDLAEGLVAAGHSATVFSVDLDSQGSETPTETMRAGVRVLRRRFSAPKWMRWRPGTYWQRWQLLQWIKSEHRKSRFDLIESPDTFGWLPFGAPKGVELVYRLHGSFSLYWRETGAFEEDTFIRGLEKRSCKRGDSFIGVSRFSLERGLAAVDCVGARGSVIYNSVDTDLFRPDESVEPERGLIVFANRIEVRKGIVELFNALPIILKRCPYARLVVVGAHVTKANSKPLGESLLESLPVELRSKVEFTGGVDRKTRLIEYLRKANVCCYPSHLETFGISPLEAMSVGKPVVNAKLTAGPELVEDGVSGVLCDPHDPQDIAEKICGVLENDDFAKSLAVGARARALTFNKPDWIRRNIEHFASLTAI